MSGGPPWMPLHIGDYLRDTGHLTVVEHGAYLLLIMRYWQDGGLPSDEKLIARYAHLTAEQWGESRDILAVLFDEGWKHKRIDAELAKAGEIISKRVDAGKRRHSTRSAHAEQVDSESSYAGASPLPKPIPEEPPVAPQGGGAGDLFGQVWEAFPRNPTSNEGRAEAIFRATKAKDQTAILAAAQRYSRWFTEECERRKKPRDERLSFVPHLGTWIETGAWRSAGDLPLKAENATVVVPMVKLDRVADAALWAACERLQGKRAPTSDNNWHFRADLVSEAKAMVLQ